MGIFKTTFFIVGTSIGAGFLSGAELVRFFRVKSVLPALVLSFLLFFALTSLFLLLGKRHGGYTKTMGELFGRGGKWMRTVISLLSFVPCAGMLAGLDALAPKFSPLLSLLGLAAVLLFLRKGTRGITLLNCILVPVLVAFVLIFARGGTLVSPLPAGAGMGALYAGMNVLLAVPVLLDVGAEAERPVLSALFASLLIFLCACAVLGAIFREGESAVGAELPFLCAMRGNKIFYVASGLAIVTSLGSALYPLLALCEGLPSPKTKNAARGVVLAAAFGLSRLGLSGIVRLLYPALGGVGLAFSILCILYEYLFEKHHEEVHSRGERTENDGRRHHKVEFKHLPAVHDEISEPRAGHDIFAHDRADPAHAHGDFQHGDKCRAR